MINLPYEINKFIKDCEVNEVSIGCSDTSVFRVIDKNNDCHFLKIGGQGSLSKEYAALSWLKGKIQVPNCEIFCSDGKKEYMLTRALKGEMSCSEKHIKAPNETIKLLSEAMLLLQKVDIQDCPFRSDLNYKLGIAEYNIKNNLLTSPMTSKIGRNFSSYSQLLAYLKNNKPEEELVFSHGDTSLPNIFFDGGKISGFIDVGECGVCDKWFDIAITCKSIRRNFKNHEELIDLFLHDLGLEYNSAIDYYEAVMDLYL